MYLRRIDITPTVVTTSDGSSVTAYSTGAVNGLVHSITYERSSGSPFTTTGTVTFTGADTTQAIFADSCSAASWTVCPRYRKILDTTGDVINPTSAASVDSNNSEKIPIVGERLKVVVAGASGASLTGTFRVYMEGGAI
jgi:hypothetical protein